MLMLLKSTYKILLLLLTVTAISCSSRSALSFTTYEEASEPIVYDTISWAKVKPDVQTSFVSTFVRFKKHDLPFDTLQKTWKSAAWRGERVSVQFAVWAAVPINQVEFEFSNFIGKNGSKLPATIAKARFERFVLTDEFGNECGFRKPEDYAVSLVADLLDTLHSFNIDAQTVRPVWISIDVPRDAVDDVYKSTLAMFVNRKMHSSYSLELEVLPQLLSTPREWEFHLDLWQNPYAVARYHNVEKWSEKHWDYLKPMMGMLAEAGQKVITTTLNKRPWGGQTYDAYDSMIAWTKKKDGSWHYDYSIFDKWVSFMMQLGIDKQINCYSTVGWGNTYYYFDEEVNQEVELVAVPSSAEYKALWTPFLKDFHKHIAEKGWQKITRLSMDEREPEEMKAALQLLKDVVPELGVSLADSHKSYKLYAEQLKDISVLHGSTVDDYDLDYRRSKGMITTYYACCANSFPNTFTYSPPAEGVFTAWYAKAAGFDGFLRWAYNSWVENPLIDSRFRKWPAGDPFIVYPDARSSIRFETLREGIQDMEKVRILKKQFEKSDSKEAKMKLKQLNDLIVTFNFTAKPVDLESRLIIGKKTLLDLSR